MLFPSFGQKIAQDLVPVKQLMGAMKQMGSTTISSIDAQLLLRELYDQNFQISAHADPRRPLSLVAKHTKELVNPYTRQYRLYRRFAALRVGDLFNISINDFMQQPRELVELMFQIAEDKTVTEDRQNASMNRKLEEAMRGDDK